MEGPGRERRPRWALIALTLLLALGLAASSPAHKALHADHGDEGDCVACALTPVEGPRVELAPAPPAGARVARAALPLAPELPCACQPHAPRGPPVAAS